MILKDIKKIQEEIDFLLTQIFSKEFSKDCKKKIKLMCKGFDL